MQKRQPHRRTMEDAVLFERTFYDPNRASYTQEARCMWLPQRNIQVNWYSPTKYDVHREDTGPGQRIVDEYPNGIDLDKWTSEGAEGAVSYLRSEITRLERAKKTIRHAQIQAADAETLEQYVVKQEQLEQSKERLTSVINHIFNNGKK